MKKAVTSLLSLLVFATVLVTGCEEKEKEKEKEAPQVAFETNAGQIVIELYPDKAPKTVDNFLQYVKDGFYDGTIFHRVVPKFIVQGGGITVDLKEKETRPPIPNEANNGLSNLKGTVAMARKTDPQSATSQFFINLVDNAFLDFEKETIKEWGYAVFGKVIKGMEIVTAMEKLRPDFKSRGRQRPENPVIIHKARIL